MSDNECPGPNYVWDHVPCPDAKLGDFVSCSVRHMGWVKIERPLADRVADLERAAQKPALTGEQVRAAFAAEFGRLFGIPKVEAVANADTGPLAEAWDRVAARLAKP